MHNSINENSAFLTADKNAEHYNDGPASMALGAAVKYQSEFTYENIISYHMNNHGRDRVLNPQIENIIQKAAVLYEMKDRLKEKFHNIFNFKKSLAIEYVTHNLFESKNSIIRFAGNTLANAKDLSVDDIAKNDSYFSNIANYQSISIGDRSKIIKEFCAKNSIDTQFRFGTMANAMASIMLRYCDFNRVAHNSYTNESAVYMEFDRFVKHWSPAHGNNPIIQLASIMSVSNGNIVNGNTAVEKLHNALGNLVTHYDYEEKRWKWPSNAEFKEHFVGTQLKQQLEYFFRNVSPTALLWRGGREHFGTNQLDHAPFVSNLMQTYEALRAGEYRQAARDFATVVPFAGGAYLITEGLFRGNILEVYDGAQQLGMDILTFGLARFLAPKAAISKVTSLVKTGGRNTSPISISELSYESRQLINHRVLPLRNIGIDRVAIDVSGDAALSSGHLNKYIVRKPDMANFWLEKHTPLADKGHRLIQMQHEWYMVEWDNSNQSWRIISPDNPVTYKVPVRYQNGQWVEHGEVGLPGGVDIHWPDNEYDFVAVSRGLDKTFFKRKDGEHGYGWMQIRNTAQNRYNAVGLIANEIKNNRELRKIQELEPLIIEIGPENLPKPKLSPAEVAQGYYIQKIDLFVEMKPIELKSRLFGVDNEINRNETNISNHRYSYDTFATLILNNPQIRNNIVSVTRNLELVKKHIKNIGKHLQELSIAFTNDGRVKLIDYGGSGSNVFGTKEKLPRVEKALTNMIDAIHKKAQAM